MAILDKNQLRAIRQRNEMEMDRGSKSAHGYPKEIIHNLLQTIDFLAKEKKKWQRVAEHRGDRFRKIVEICADAANTPEKDEKGELL